MPMRLKAIDANAKLLGLNQFVSVIMCAMTTYTFQAILKPHAHSAEQVASVLQALHDDVAVSSAGGQVRVTFIRQADSFSAMVLMCGHQLTEFGYTIERLAVDGVDLPLSNITDFDDDLTFDFDLEDTAGA